MINGISEYRVECQEFKHFSIAAGKSAEKSWIQMAARANSRRKVPRRMPRC